MAEYNKNSEVPYVGAPYNFVSISDKVYEKEEVPHDVWQPELKSGKIEYTIEALTPVFISEGKKAEGDEKQAEEFYRNCYGQYAIPGSSVRGLVRSNVQILSCSSVKDDIQNAKLMYREIAAGKNKDTYGTVLGKGTISLSNPGRKKVQVSVLKNVQAGYIRNENGRYRIIPAASEKLGNEFGEMNYYVASERLIIEHKYEGFEDLRKENLQNEDKPFQKITDSRGSVHYKGVPNEQYEPYWKPAAYQLKGNRQILSIMILDNNKTAVQRGYKKGCLLSSGYIQEKKALYIIPEVNEKAEGIWIPDSDIDSYRRDYEGKKNQVERISKTFFRLPEKGETKPVFYIYLDGRLYFGFTPHLRLFYQQEIYAGLSEEQKKDCVDYSKTLFGYANPKNSYKSRLSFLDAVAEGTVIKCSKKASVVLGGPKPTSYYDYLASPDGKAASYNEPFKLRGIKQYWLKQDKQEGLMNDNEKVRTSFYPLEKGTVWKGEIRFTNLTEAELGMVLWGLILEEDSNQNIGKGKPYGYGRVKIRLDGLYVLDLKKLYEKTNLCMNPYQDETHSAKSYILAAKEEMTAFLGYDVMKQKGVKELLLMKDSTKIPSEEKTRYMRLDGKKGEKSEYQKRANLGIKLQEAEEIIQGKELVYQKKQNSGNPNKRSERKNNDGRNERRKNDSQNIGTSLGDLLKNIKL